MPYQTGTAASLDDLLTQITAWATDAAIHGDDAWELMRSDPWPRGTIFKAKGLGGINNCYIGLLLVTHVKGSSYHSWLLQTPVLSKHIVRSAAAMGLTTAPFIHTNGSPSFSVPKNAADLSKGYTVYTLSDYDIVNSSGTALAFGVFKQYAGGLDWNEQPGAIEFGELAQFPLTCSFDDNTKTFAPPVYPGVGYPGIGLPAGEPAAGELTFWATKDACRLTVVINNGDYWDIGHAGLLVPFPAAMGYAFPAVVAGSCTGLVTVAATDGNGKVTKGDKIDYAYQNTLARNLPCSPSINTARAPAEVSQLAVCLPDGQWKFFSNWTQELKTRTDSSGNKYFPIGVPERQDSSGYKVKPTHLELGGLVSYDAADGETTDFAIEALDLWHESGDLGTTDMLGSLWNLYWPGIDNVYGELTLGGKKHLLLPNCWAERMWYYPDVDDVVAILENNITHQAVNFADVVAFYNEIVKYGRQVRMLIRLED